MSGTTLDSFMQLKSIDPHFINTLGEPAMVTDENIKNIVQRLGFDADDDGTLLSHYKEEETRHWLSLLASVSVFQQSASYELEVHLPIDFVTDQLLYRVTTEDGLQIDELLTATDFPLLAVNEISEVEFQLYNVTLPIQLDLGYHHLALLEVGNEEPLAVMPLIITPDTCYQSEQIPKDKKIISTNLSLPLLESGVGTLKEPIAQTAKEASKLIHLSFDTQLESLPELWSNLLRIDLSLVAEFKECKAAQKEMSALNGLTNDNVIEVINIKLVALRHVFNAFNGSRQDNIVDEFSTFMTEGAAALKQKASFNALHYKFLSEKGATDYSVWPTDFESYSSQGTQDWIIENDQEVLFGYYCHWILELQLTMLNEFIHTQENTLGLYKQIMIGAVKNSVEMWAENDIYCQNINIEAPLDSSISFYKSLGYSPLIPDQLYKAGYQPFINLLQSSMRYTGVLHIEHIAALLRLWWVPEGANKEQGAFVYYNVYDMLNLLALESTRNSCVVVSDHLELLPDGMNELLEETGIYKLSSFDFR